MCDCILHWQYSHTSVLAPKWPVLHLPVLHRDSVCGSLPTYARLCSEFPVVSGLWCLSPLTQWLRGHRAPTTAYFWWNRETKSPIILGNGVELTIQWFPRKWKVTRLLLKITWCSQFWETSGLEASGEVWGYTVWASSHVGLLNTWDMSSANWDVLWAWETQQMLRSMWGKE